MIHNDTIAAVSTPAGVGGVALIRISGDGAVAAASKVFFPASGKKLTDAEHSRSYYGRIFEGGEAIDDGMATVFYGPRSFTGEDTVEITCHGGILITERVLSAVLAAGARAAGPGEFTRRAFVSGKLTLAEAEATGDLIHAKTGSQLALASPASRARLSESVSGLRGKLLELLARTSVRLDYPEEDLSDIDESELLSETEALLSETEALRATYRTARAVSVGINTVICGRPNAGKSTLYNLFLGQPAAIVTDIPGTTRDVLTSEASAGRVLLRLSDTAGIRESLDPVEKIGVSRARESIMSSELLIAVHDASVPPDDDDRFVLGASAPVKLAVVNKIDIAPPERVAEYSELAASFGAVPVLCALSEGKGFPQLVEKIEASFTDGELRLGHDALIMNARQSAEVGAAAASLLSAADALRRGLPVDIAVSELSLAHSALCRLDGADASEEVISEVFSKFCVGK